MPAKVSLSLSLSLSLSHVLRHHIVWLDGELWTIRLLFQGL